MLRRRLQEANRHVPRTSGIDQDIRPPAPSVELPVDARALADLASRVFARPTQEPDLDHLDLELPSVESAIDEIRARVQSETIETFDNLTEHCRRPVEVAAYFLALLVLGMRPANFAMRSG